MKSSDIRKGIVIMHNNAPHRVIEFNHLTPGNLKAYYAVKLRNLLTGNQSEQRYSSGSSVEEANVYYSKATYLYSDNTNFNFMRAENFEEFSMTAEQLGDAVYYLQEQMQVDVTDWNDSPIAVVIPQTVVLTIVETEPELKGSTASNSPKPAKTDTGLTLSVPAFIKEGEKIIVNTQEGTYVKRAEG